MFQLILLLQILLMGIAGHNAVTANENDDSFNEPEKQHIINTYQKGDGGNIHPDLLKREQRDASHDRTQLPSSSGISPFVSPVQTSYFMGQCLMCPPGSAGPRGPPGSQGQNGRDGRDGRDQSLYPLPAVETTEPPERAPTQIVNHTNVGVTYVRWGRTTCPSSSRVVYEGIMAGGKYSEKGGGANYLCLTTQPIYDRPQTGIQFSAYIYGTEYEFSGLNAMPALYNQDVPCVVCLATVKHQALMIPGQNICPTEQEWTLEYAGFIMAERYTQQRTEYICMDKEAEGIPRTGHENNLSLIRPVEIKCGSNGGGLPCPPYVDGYELTCAVCTI